MDKTKIDLVKLKEYSELLTVNSKNILDIFQVMRNNIIGLRDVGITSGKVSSNLDRMAQGVTALSTQISGNINEYNKKIQMVTMSTEEIEQKYDAELGKYFAGLAAESDAGALSIDYE